MRRKTPICLMAIAVVTALSGGGSASGAVADPDDDKVTDHQYVRHDGGTDQGIRECSDNASNPAPDDDLDDGDSDSNDGGNNRQDNEPYSVIDPSDPDTIVAGTNDYCLNDLNAGWEGFAFSRDFGETWTSSLVPGYPQDTSAEGMQSPLFGDHRDAGDPIAAFNNQGRLYVGGIAFNRSGATNGDVWVASYGAQDQPNGYPVDYERTVIVGEGSAARNFWGIFQDKPLLEVDRTSGRYDGNVYVCWSRFTGFGQNKIYFSRSTDDGRTFSRPIAISRTEEIKSVQGCDIAIESDGDVYVTFRTFGQNQNQPTGLGYARSTDGGVSFSRARLIRPILPFAPRDGGRDCGDGPFLCPSDFVFHRYPLEPRVTADQSGELRGIYLTYNEIRPGSQQPSTTSYSSGSFGQVGQSLVYVLRSLNNGRNWSEPEAVDPNPLGQQYFPDIDAYQGQMIVVWQDSRTDPSAGNYQFPPGNTYVTVDGEPRAVSTGESVINTFVSTYEASGQSWADAIKVSDVSHQPHYEMFGDRQIPFQGDYNWASIAQRTDGSLYAYVTWTDNRDVVEGSDPREDFQDGFDVAQCRTDLGEEEGARPNDGPNYNGPRSRTPPFTRDNCGNSGGLNQNIYGNSLDL